jgi:cell pole-organizing protein PopZ
MSRPGQTGEPSMEDILASIRKIIAEEPEAPERPVPSRTAEVFAAPKNEKPLTPVENARPGGLPLNELTNALNATFGAAKSRPADDDLADLLDEPADTSKDAAQSSGSLGNRLDEVQTEVKVVPVQDNKGKSENGANGVSWSHSRLSFKPEPSDDKANAAAAPAPKVEKTIETTSSLGDVRPQSSFPASMSVRSFKAAFPPSEASLPKADPLKPFRTETARPLNGSAHGLSNGAAKHFDKPAFGMSSAPKESEPSSPVPEKAEKSAPEVIAAMPSSIEVESALRPRESAEPASGAPASAYTPPPASATAGLDALTASASDRRLKTEPFRGVNGEASASTMPPPALGAEKSAAISAEFAKTAPEPQPQPAVAESFEATSAEAAVSALDALAAGLAASSHTGAGSQQASAPPPIVDAIPVSGILTDRAIAVRSEPQPKTMEETVTELLKPLLREWLAENMPRMLEKALRSEAADGSKR